MNDDDDSGGHFQVLRLNTTAHALSRKWLAAGDDRRQWVELGHGPRPHRRPTGHVCMASTAWTSPWETFIRWTQGGAQTAVAKQTRRRYDEASRAWNLHHLSSVHSSKNFNFGEIHRRDMMCYFVWGPLSKMYFRFEFGVVKLLITALYDKQQD